MLSKVLGGSLLIVGTAIGAGMLALPVATAAGGFYHSWILFLGVWLYTVFAAFLMLEVNLWLPPDTNLVSMAKATLGRVGEIATWFCYLFLLYCLLSAYSAGGSDLLHSLFLLANWQTARWLDSIIFVTLLGSIIVYGIRAVDFANRGLMIVKLGSYTFLIALVVPHVDINKLEGGQFHMLGSALMVVVTSFGYSVIIPSLRTYFNSNVNMLRLTIALGSLISLVCYLLWDLAVQGTVGASGPAGLISIASSGHTASQLTQALSQQANGHISELAHVFTSVCMTTSFLGVGLCLKDFLRDGIHAHEKNRQRHPIWVPLLTFAPPLGIVIIYPKLFIMGLTFAGILCVLLLILIPSLMAWSGRYVKKIATGYQVWGGRTLLAIEIIISVTILILAAFHIVD